MIFLLLGSLLLLPTGIADLCSTQELDRCFRKMDPLLSGRSHLGGLASTKEELRLVCSAFKTGMSCVDEYGSKCLNPNQNKLLSDRLNGARQVMLTVCQERKLFKANGKYDCFRDLVGGIAECSNPLHDIRYKKMYKGQNESLVELCCAQKSFLACVSDEAGRICDDEAVSLALQLIDVVWSPQLQQQCNDTISEIDCSSAWEIRVFAPLWLICLSFFVCSFR